MPKTSWPTVELGSYITQSLEKKRESQVPVYSVTKHKGFVTGYFNKDVHSNDTSRYKLVRAGEFAYATIHLDEGSVGIAPEDCAISPMYTVFSIDKRKFHPPYLLHFLKSPSALAQYPLLGKGSIERRKNIGFRSFQKVRIPLPPLDEQRRIAGILDTASQLVGPLSKQMTETTSIRSKLVESWISRFQGNHVPLSSIAEIQSGITKGRTVPSDATLMPYPYLAVSNVKDGYLDLQTVKEIAVTENEVRKFSLRVGDIVLTEGGDPDKLGRGTVWNGEVDPCLHQNHIFRVRLGNEDSNYTPQVLAAVLGSTSLKKYFLKSAKQTTGIASINKTQLSAALVPEFDRQTVAKIHDQIVSTGAILEKLEERKEAHHSLMRSLTTRAFQGEL